MASKRYPSVRPEKGDSRLQANASTDKFDQHMQRFQGKDGTLRGHPASIRKIILSLGERIRG
jgi:hypothetical protein